MQGPTTLPYATAAPRGFSMARPVHLPTLMLVEDSRYTSEVIRLYARVLGLRLRRAANLETAAGHLALYHPDIVMIDLGLPDGRGEALVARLTAISPRPPLIIAISGQGELRAGALAAGADIFIEKPIPDIAAFRALLVDHFPSPLPLALLPERPPSPRPDHVPLRDDLTMAALELSKACGRGGSIAPAAGDLDSDLRIAAMRTQYIAGLLDGIAGSLGDKPLQNAARGQLHAAGYDGQGTAVGAGPTFRRLRDLVNERLRDVMAEREI